MTDLGSPDEVVIPRFHTVRSTRINRTIEEAGIIKKYLIAAMYLIEEELDGEDKELARKKLKNLCAASIGAASNIRERLEGMK